MDQQRETVGDIDVADSESTQNPAEVEVWESEVAPSVENHEEFDMEEEEMFDYTDEDSDSTDSTNSSVQIYEEFDYCPNEQVLDPEEIVKHMVDCITYVTNLTKIPTTAARILLNHFNWDEAKLIERFFEDDQDKLFAEAGVVNPFETSDDATTSEAAGECGICFDTLPLTKSECDHSFCTECWRRYLTGKIMEEGVGQTIACASSGCDIFIDDATVMRLLANDPDVKLKYQRLITNSFVACNRLLRWCPSANCNNAIRVRHVDTIQRVTCRCRHVFCFDCGEDWHDPIKCDMLKKWKRRCNEDAQTSQWVAANVKGCPECDAAIEKNGGCCHMKCTNPSCRFEFCWTCMAPWQGHYATMQCNLYDSQKAPRRQSSLHKYLFFCDRYMNHKTSLKLEHRLYATVEWKMAEMQRPPLAMSWIDVQFLKSAVDDLVQCRQALMYTYAFAFYLRKNGQSEIFAENQRDLERATETLSEYLERDLIESTNCDEIKRKIQDKCKYCKNRQRVLLEHVHEGYDNDSWKYIEV